MINFRIRKEAPKKSNDITMDVWLEEVAGHVSLYVNVQGKKSAIFCLYSDGTGYRAICTNIPGIQTDDYGRILLQEGTVH